MQPTRFPSVKTFRPQSLTHKRRLFPLTPPSPPTYHRAVIIPDHPLPPPLSDPAGPQWHPDEFGLVRALVLSAALVSALIGGVATFQPPHHQPDTPVPMAVHLVELPADNSTKPPVAQAETPPIQPDPPLQDTIPEPIPAGIPDTAETIPVPAVAPPALVLPEKPRPSPPMTRPAPPQAAPRQRPPSSIAHPSPTNPAPTPAAAIPTIPVQRSVPAPPLDTSSGIGPYRAGLHLQIERNLAAGAELQAIGETGTAVIEASIRPDGQVISARIAHSSGSRTLDLAALAALQRGGFQPFGPHMPEGPITISVPITLTSS